MTVAKATNAKRFAMALKKNGVTHIYGQSNPPTIMVACMEEGIRQMSFRQENTGSYMAHGYAVTAKKAGIVAAQSGPAATLLVPGLAECLKAGHPVIAIVEEVNANERDKNSFQELDQENMFMPVAKWVRTVPSQERIEDYVDMAFMAATSGKPGPAVILCPINIFWDMTEYPVPNHRVKNLGTYPLDRFTADNKLIAEAAKMIAEAENPIIYAGGGVISSGAQEELREIQERFSIPVASSTMGKGAVDEKHFLSMGPIGYYMGKRGYSKFLKPMVTESDLVVLIGNRTNKNGTDGWTLLPKNAKYIHIDIDPMEIGRNYEAMRLLGDAKYTIAALIKELEKIDTSKRASRRAGLEKTIKSGLDAHFEEIRDVVGQNIKPIRIEDFLCEADKHFDDDHIIVADASLSSVWVANYTTATKQRKHIFPRGIAGLGWGMGLAMGAATAAPDRKVFCLAGDGGFGHAWVEMEAAKKEGLKVVMAVINNEVLGYQALAEEALFGNHTNATELMAVDHAKIAEACGWKGITLSDPQKMPEVIEEAFNYDGCVLIDIITEPVCVAPLPFMENIDGKSIDEIRKYYSMV
jgi:acetolactate synthase-1/2/3 large subunit